MGAGIKFFSFNYASALFGGCYNASSSPERVIYSFDGSKNTRWISSGGNSDSREVSIIRDFQTNRQFDRIYIYNTNIIDPKVEYWTNEGWLKPKNLIIKKSIDEQYYLFEFDTVFSQKIKVSGSKTNISNSEKYITEIFCFQEIGQLLGYPDIEPKISIDQTKVKLINAKYHIIDKGERFEVKIKFRSHINQHDIDIIEKLKERHSEFYILLCGGDETQYQYRFKPYRFQDIYKVALSGDYKPTYTKNYYRAGLNDTLSLIEVV